MKRHLPLAVFGVLVLSPVLSVVPAFAHHGFQFEYDGSKYVTITGVLRKVEWENPHIYFNVDVTSKDGKVTSWRFEGSSVTLRAWVVTEEGTLCLDRDPCCTENKNIASAERRAFFKGSRQC